MCFDMFQRSGRIFCGFDRATSKGDGKEDHPTLNARLVGRGVSYSKTADSMYQKEESDFSLRFGKKSFQECQVRC